MTPPSQQARTRLQDFLQDAFDDDGFEIFWKRAFGADAMNGLRQGTLAVFVDSAVAQLAMQHTADVEFFRQLAQARKRRSEEIWEIAGLWGVFRPDQATDVVCAPPIVRDPPRPRWTARPIAAAALLSLALFAGGFGLGRWSVELPGAGEANPGTPPQAADIADPAPSPVPAVADGQIPFKPSNIDLAGVKLEGLGDLDVHGADCVILTDVKLGSEQCGSIAGVAFSLVDQPDGSRIAVYFARHVRVARNAKIRFIGTNAGALVAVDTMEIFGTLEALPSSLFSEFSPGGYSSDDYAKADRGGPGRGRAADDGHAGGGGSFCGFGGKGAATSGETPLGPGRKYGSSRVVPLLGGSAGGEAGAGSGGGAVQLVAGKSIRIAADGKVDTLGAMGITKRSTEETSLHGYGGGSGGAILLEAPIVIVEGSLTANGGRGSVLREASKSAADEQPVAQAAHGGAGSADAVLDGKDGTLQPDGQGGGGGGGGAGRIRINTWDGKATITGKVSPALTTDCATLGMLER